jgi:hypothetical protein
LDPDGTRKTWLCFSMPDMPHDFEAIGVIWVTPENLLRGGGHEASTATDPTPLVRPTCRERPTFSADERGVLDEGVLHEYSDQER